MVQQFSSFSKYLILVLSVTVLVGLHSKSAQARVLNEREILARCYAQLTGERLANSSPLYQQLQNTSASSVCKAMLENVSLGQDGLLVSADPLSKQILRQFHHIHSHWLLKRLILTGTFRESFPYMMDVFDGEEPAYHLTRALFTPSRHYSSVLQGAESLEALRDPNRASAAGSPTGFKRFSRALFGADDGDAGFNINSPAFMYTEVPANDVTQFRSLPIPLVQVGSLLGVRPRPTPVFTPHLYLTILNGVQQNPPGLAVPHNLFGHYGGGAIGSYPFLMTNLGYDFDYAANGTTKLPRKWIEATLKTFLCREGPWTRDSDVGVYRSTNPEAAPFRTATSCLRCHATMDQAALTARNLVLGATSINLSHPARSTASIINYLAAAPAQPNQEAWPVTPVADFYRQNPNGTLFLRSINGQLIQVPVQIINDLGFALTQT